MNLKVVFFNDLEKWDRLVSEKQGSLFLYADVLNFFKGEDVIPVLLGFFSGNDLVAILGGMQRPLGKSSERMWYFYSGILYLGESDAPMVNRCKNQLIAFARQNQVSRVVIKAYDDVKFLWSKSPGFGFIRDREECYVDLQKKYKDLESGFSAETRRVTRKALRLGVNINQSNSSTLLDTLFDLIDTTFRVRNAKGYGHYHQTATPFIGRKELVLLLEQGLGEIAYLEYDNEIVCIQYNLTAGNTVYGLYMGTSAEGYKLSAASVLVYLSALDFARRGFIRYNLGGIPMSKRHHGVRRFKLSLGSVFLPLKEEASEFLIPPLSPRNFLLYTKKFFSSVRIPWRLKKLIMALHDRFLGYTDAT